MKFVALYSAGKDSMLSLYRMIQQGHTPLCLIIMYNKEADRSWFHGVTTDLLEATANSLGIPIERIVCTGDSYVEDQERKLREVRERGAEAAVFGDIDIEGHREWNEERCENTGLACIMPLWHEPREALVAEFIESGFKAMIKSVDLSCLDESFLGKVLDERVVEELVAAGSDACGENGEYHTFVFDGPLFSHPLPIRTGEIVNFTTHAAIDIVLAEE